MRTVLCIVCLAFLLSGCATIVGPPPLSVEEVIQLSKAGTAAEVIIQKIRDTRAVYALSASQLIKLHEQGVPDAVLDYMQLTYLNDVLDEGARQEWTRQQHLWPRYPYPYWRSRPPRYYYGPYW